MQENNKVDYIKPTVIDFGMLEPIFGGVLCTNGGMAGCDKGPDASIADCNPNGYQVFVIKE